jgi:hypothetical protein
MRKLWVAVVGLAIVQALTLYRLYWLIRVERTSWGLVVSLSQHAVLKP